ncbi:MAG: hypothetical protein K8R58_10635 [Bacteroidales bacterium]|nr:hypothetical protein [Bacteroidales bacterium]
MKLIGYRLIPEDNNPDSLKVEKMGVILIKGKSAIFSEHDNIIEDYLSGIKNSKSLKGFHSFQYQFDNIITNFDINRLNTRLEPKPLYKHIYKGTNPIWPIVIYVRLNRIQKTILSWKFGKTIVHDKSFWMWVINISVAILAIVVSYMAIFKNN